MGANSVDFPVGSIVETPNELTCQKSSIWEAIVSSRCPTEATEQGIVKPEQGIALVLSKKTSPPMFTMSETAVSV